MAFNDIRASTLMAYNGSAIKDCLMTSRLFVIQCHSVSASERMSFNVIHCHLIADFFAYSEINFYICDTLVEVLLYLVELY